MHQHGKSEPHITGKPTRKGGSGLDWEDDPDSHERVNHDQNSDSGEFPDPSNPPQEIHYRKGLHGRARSLWFWSSALGCTLLIILVSEVLATQLGNYQKTYAAGLKQNSVTAITTARGAIQLAGTGNNAKLTFSADVEKTGLDNTSIVCHVHDKSAMGTILFVLGPENTDSKGKIDLGSKQFTKENGPKTSGQPLPNAIPNDWFFNCHDAQVKDPKTGDPVSLGAARFAVAGNKAKANFKNSKVQIPS